MNKNRMAEEYSSIGCNKGFRVLSFLVCVSLKFCVSALVKWYPENEKSL